LHGRRAVAVLDQNLAPGQGGILFQEIAACLYQAGQPFPVACSFIGGLGGKNVSEGEFDYIFEATAKAAERGRGIGPVLLYTEAERREIEQLQLIAREIRANQ
jgi:pyruvate ferredoxin oxidoreductase alpha subunit